MLESNLIYIYFCIIIILQSIIGVGVLVLGTPFLLILDYNIVEVFYILLPISIITSLLNLIIIKLSNKHLSKSTYKEFKKFFKICIPSIFFGLILLKYLQDLINFKFLVSLVIFCSISLISLKDRINYKINFFRISILSFVGIIHGLTNSGGTLMSLALSANNKKDYTRFNTTLFYLILAFFQYFLTIIIFYDDYTFPKDLSVILVLIVGVFIGNVTNYFLNNHVFKILVNFLAIISALILIIY